mmetsp:Transcript_39408/g.103163  ORF Transcript_39408/g.103163 Transcript_39408/m.103163 type:complete len:554 (-) Transcript_39408:219-1880(-)
MSFLEEMWNFVWNDDTDTKEGFERGVMWALVVPSKIFSVLSVWGLVNVTISLCMTIVLIPLMCDIEAFHFLREAVTLQAQLVAATVVAGCGLLLLTFGLVCTVAVAAGILLARVVPWCPALMCCLQSGGRGNGLVTLASEVVGCLASGLLIVVRWNFDLIVALGASNFFNDTECDLNVDLSNTIPGLGWLREQFGRILCYSMTESLWIVQDNSGNCPVSSWISGCVVGLFAVLVYCGFLMDGPFMLARLAYWTDRTLFSFVASTTELIFRFLMEVTVFAGAVALRAGFQGAGFGDCSRTANDFIASVETYFGVALALAFIGGVLFHCIFWTSAEAGFFFNEANGIAQDKETNNSSDDTLTCGLPVPCKGLEYQHIGCLYGFVSMLGIWVEGDNEYLFGLWHGANRDEFVLNRKGFVAELGRVETAFLTPRLLVIPTYGGIICKFVQYLSEGKVFYIGEHEPHRWTRVDSLRKCLSGMRFVLLFLAWLDSAIFASAALGLTCLVAAVETICVAFERIQNRRNPKVAPEKQVGPAAAVFGRGFEKVDECTISGDF